MGEIKVGDTVFDERGKPCRDVAKSDLDFEEQAFRITFKDGAVVDAGENHQWAGEYTYGKNKPCIMNTRELYEMPRDGTCYRFRIAVADCAEYSEAKLPVDPYLMGYWLGNGNGVKPEVTIKAGDIPGVFPRIAAKHKAETAWQNTGDSVVFRIPDLKAVLVRSFHDKIIPEQYLRSSREQRLALLQGLMDSDGSINALKGQANYVSTERALSESVSELLWSLGIKNAISTVPSTQRADWGKPSCECGRVATGETLYHVKFTAFKDIRVAGLDRKYNNSVERNPATRSHYR